MRVVMLLLVLFASASAAADAVHVAVATNFAPTCRAIAGAFSAATQHEVVISHGSSGKLFAQIENGAPFEVFLSADAARPRELERGGHSVTGSRFAYALGRLALWSPRPQISSATSSVLRGDAFQHLAIANPELAPYGAAARDVLQHLGLWERAPAEAGARRGHRPDLPVRLDGQRRTGLRGAVAAHARSRWIALAGAGRSACADRAAGRIADAGPVRARRAGVPRFPEERCRSRSHRSAPATGSRRSRERRPRGAAADAATRGDLDGVAAAVRDAARVVGGAHALALEGADRGGGGAAAGAAAHRARFLSAARARAAGTAGIAVGRARRRAAGVQLRRARRRLGDLLAAVRGAADPGGLRAARPPRRSKPRRRSAPVPSIASSASRCRRPGAVSWPPRCSASRTRSASSAWC